jgi:hypothetical protein
MPNSGTKNWGIKRGWAFALGLVVDLRWFSDMCAEIRWSNWWIIWLIAAVGFTFMMMVGVLMKHSAHNAKKSGKSGAVLSPGVHATGNLTFGAAYAGATLHYLATLAWTQDATSLFLAFFHGTLWLLNAAAHWLLVQSHSDKA